MAVRATAIHSVHLDLVHSPIPQKKKKKAFFAEGGFVHSVFTSTQAEVLEVPAEQELRKIRIRIKRIFHRNDDGLFHCDIGTVYLGNVKALQHEIQNVIYNI